jgi:hypothetical protein
VRAALAACTGCAQLFGLVDTTGVDANVDFATLQVQRVSIGATVIKAPQDLTGQTAQFFQDDNTRLDGQLMGTDTFTSVLPGTPPVLFTVPDMLVPKRLMALPARNQKNVLLAYEHPGKQPPLPSSQIALAVTLPSNYTTGQTFAVQSIGAWMGYDLVAADLPAVDTSNSISRTIPYTAFNSMVGGEKSRITMSDVTLVLRYTGAALSGVLQAQFDQTDGADGVSGTMSAVTADKMAGGMVDAANITTRFTAVRPTTAAPAFAWAVTAAPAWSLGISTGVRLSSGTVAAAATTFDTAMWGNPFESLDWKAVLAFSASSSRTYTYTENAVSLAVSLSTAMTQLAEPSTTLDVTMPAGLPTTVRANQMLLTSDGMTVPLDLTKPVEVDAIVDKPSNTLYELAVVQLGIDATGTAPVITRTIVLYMYTTATGMPLFKVPPDTFTVGNTYYITVRSYQGGFTSAADGDLTVASLPLAASVLDSGVFTVGTP